MNKPQLLIVGINSFLGKAIYDLVNEQYAVTGIYHVNRENIPVGAEAVSTIDLPGLKNRVFKHIYLISSYVPDNNTVVDDEQLIQSNILLPQQLSALFPESRIIFCSSVAVYENLADTNNISISQPPAPKSKYAISKLWGERIIEGHASYAIMRISSMYGIGMKRSTFIPRIIDDAIVKGEITLLGDGKRIQNYIHVTDVANIAVKLAHVSNNVALLAINNQSYTNKNIAEMILEITPGQLRFFGTDDSKSYSYNNTGAGETLGEIKFKSIKDGLKELIEWRKKEF